MADTTVDRYIALLETIQSTTSAETVSITNDGTELDTTHLIDIDWDTRTVTLPSAYSSYIGVVSDHRAATVYFSADRYFDNVDLTKLNFSIEFINAAGEGRIYPVVDYDLSIPGKILFGWKLGYETTKKSGKVQFIVHVYSVDPVLHKYTYSMSTQPCQAVVLSTIAMAEDPSVQDTYGMDTKEVEDLFGRLTALEQKAVAWYDLSGEPEGTNNNAVPMLFSIATPATVDGDNYDPSMDRPDYWTEE